MANELTITQQFNIFRAANPWVEEELARLALELRKKGRRRIGMKMLFEVVRWQFMRRTEDPNSNFQLNNNYTSRYARLLEFKYPALRGLFETRRLKTR